MNEYTHIQDTESQTWSITHNLNTENIEVVCQVQTDDILTKVIPLAIALPTTLAVTIHFVTPYSGTAVIRERLFSR